ncbi:hypothetical protein [Dactylosporangium darangshiense]|uniref:hypothetical protein n=1 Tax=Dactylosporangium darangshiense TaxID=579108 RepID=UPI00363FF7BD
MTSASPVADTSSPSSALTNVDFPRLICPTTATRIGSSSREAARRSNTSSRCVAGPPSAARSAHPCRSARTPLFPTITHPDRRYGELAAKVAPQ